MKRLEHKVILVTGASGFIGLHLAARLSKIDGVRLLLLSRQAKQTGQQGVVWLKAELGRLNRGYWRSQGVDHIDYVFHLGGFIPKVSTEANRIDQAIEDNILGTRALIKSLPGRIEKLVFSSTLDVYAPLDSDEVLTESSKVAPSSFYGASKLLCETLISAWANESGCDYTILRYGHVYGPGEGQYGKLIPTVIRNLLANQAPVIHGDGSTLRDYIYVGDAVEATLRAALVGASGPLNVVRGESLSLKEIADLLIRLTGSNKEIEFLPEKPNGNSLRADKGPMTRSLGEWSMTSLDEGLAAEVDSFREPKINGNEQSRVESLSDWYLTEQLDFDKRLIRFRYETIKPKLVGSRGLELGPADGEMTQFLINHFAQLTIVEGSGELLAQIPEHANLKKVHAIFEEFQPDQPFDSIIMEHILEHVVDPVGLLSRVKNWLAPNGRLLLGVPNGNSIHRLVAVKMGLLDNPCQLNSRDYLLGHRRVYVPDTFRADIEESGLKIIEMGGVYFKPLSNEQIQEHWSEEMIQGFYELGKDFSEQAAEIYAVCYA